MEETSGPPPDVFSLSVPAVEGFQGLSKQQLMEVYCIDRCVQWIRERGFRKVAIQLPRPLFKHMPPISLLLQELLPQVQVSCVLSPFSGCCVNFKDTMYRSHDSLLQFGQSCLTQSAHIPVLRIFFPPTAVDVPRVAEAMLGQAEIAEVLEGKSCKELVLLYDTRCAHAIGKLEAHLRAEGYKHFQVSRLLYKEEAVHEVNGPSKVSNLDQKCDCKEESITEQSTNLVQKCCKEEAVKDQSTNFDHNCCKEEAVKKESKVPNLDHKCRCTDDYSLSVCDSCSLKMEELSTQSLVWLDDSTANSEPLNDSGIIDSSVTCAKDDSLGSRNRVNLNGRLFYAPASMNRNDLTFAYIGSNGPTVTSLTLKWPQCSFHVIDPQGGAVETVNAVKHVMQRNFKIEQIRDQDKIVILHSNINLPGRKQIQARLEKLIKQSGKQLLNIISCDPNVPKLKNFEDADLFVYISCPESTICRREVDPEMFKLLCTPWEIELALNPNREWSLNYETNSAELIPNGNNFVLEPEGDSVEETVNVSLLSNKTQSLGVSETPVELGTPAMSLNSETGALMTDTQRAKQIQRILVGYSKGLVQGDVPFAGLNPDEVPLHPIDFVAEGRKGIAADYVEEPHQIESKKQLNDSVS